MAWAILLPPNEFGGPAVAYSKYGGFTEVERHVCNFATERAAKDKRVSLIKDGKCRHSAQVVWLGVDGKIRYPEDAPAEKEPFHP